MVRMCTYIYIVGFVCFAAVVVTRLANCTRYDKDYCFK